jgi:hypothetical protein
VKSIWLLGCAALAGCGVSSANVAEQGPAGANGAAANVAAPAAPSATNAATANAAASAAAPVVGNSLCTAGEDVIFSCRMGAQRVSVCGGTGAAGRTYAQYRHGTPGHLDLVYPAQTDAGPQTMTRAFTGFSGGGEAQVRFVNAGTEYVVYSGAVRTGFGADGRNNTEFEGGVLVRQSGRVLSRQVCDDLARTDADAAAVAAPEANVDLATAERFMPEGNFVDRGE